MLLGYGVATRSSRGQSWGQGVSRPWPGSRAIRMGQAFRAGTTHGFDLSSQQLEGLGNHLEPEKGRDP